MYVVEPIKVFCVVGGFSWLVACWDSLWWESVTANQVLGMPITVNFTTQQSTASGLD